MWNCVGDALCKLTIAVVDVGTDGEHYDDEK